MNSLNVSKVNDLTKSGQVALPVIFNILDKWKCSQINQMAILGLTSRSTLNKYRSNPESAKVSPDLLERMSYLLNIHKGLRILFSNDDSVYNWINKPNEHPYFAGASAMDVMKKGKVIDLYNVAARINAFRGGRS